MPIPQKSLRRKSEFFLPLSVWYTCILKVYMQVPSKIHGALLRKYVFLLSIHKTKENRFFLIAVDTTGLVCVPVTLQLSNIVLGSHCVCTDRNAGLIFPYTFFAAFSANNP